MGAEPIERTSYYNYHSIETLSENGTGIETRLVKQDKDEYWELSCERQYNEIKIDVPSFSQTPYIGVSGGYYDCDPCIDKYDGEEKNYYSGDVTSYNGQVWKATGENSNYETPGGTNDWVVYEPNFLYYYANKTRKRPIL